MPAIASRLGSAPSSAVALVGAGDPESSRLVYAMVIGLVVIGLVLFLLGIWIIRQTRADLEVLAPLERMGDGDWRKRDRSTQRRILDEVRPDGARPLDPATQPPSLDDEFELAEHPVTSFSDLGPGVPSEERDPVPAGSKVESEVESGVESESEVEVEVESESEVESGVESGVESESEVEVESGVESESEVESGVESESEVESGVESEVEVESGVESEVESGVESGVEPDAEPASDPRA